MTVTCKYVTHLQPVKTSELTCFLKYGHEQIEAELGKKVFVALDANVLHYHWLLDKMLILLHMWMFE